ncbi:hypothetical protein VP01_1036g2 [Puccinia sorghi]|uniref:Peptidase M50B-like-domain-containing protein n=1 Tax=Puccinia sorghi TaxID=27349 RepID=A0A0L6VUH7_9BASI|nr:hypothetical protein VP01_1036g2 [Puccinia sorghi]
MAITSTAIPVLLVLLVLTRQLTATAPPQNTAAAKLKRAYIHPPPPAQPTQPPNNPRQQIILQKRAPHWTTVTVFVNTLTAYAGTPIVTSSINPADQSLNTATVTVASYTQTISNNAPQIPPYSHSQYPAFSGHKQKNIQNLLLLPSPPSIPPLAHLPPRPPTAHPFPPTGRVTPERLPSDTPVSYLSRAQHKPQLYVIIMTLYLLLMLVCWNLFVVRLLIFPLKLVVIAWHELGHVVVSIFAGWPITEVQIDPGGASHQFLLKNTILDVYFPFVVGGSTKLVDDIIAPAAPLFAGYLSSCLFGGLMVFCGFDTLASKLSPSSYPPHPQNKNSCVAIPSSDLFFFLLNRIASIFIAMSFLGVMWWAISITSKILTTAALGVLVGFWFIDHAGMLRYYVLLMGVLSCWYVLFDVMDDFVFRKFNPCCPILFEQRWPKITAPQWSIIWILYSAINFAAWVLMAIAVWRQTRYARDVLSKPTILAHLESPFFTPTMPPFLPTIRPSSSCCNPASP